MVPIEHHRLQTYITFPAENRHSQTAIYNSSLIYLCQQITVSLACSLKFIIWDITRFVFKPFHYFWILKTYLWEHFSGKKPSTFQKRIENTVKHLRRSVWRKYLTHSFTISAKNSILDLWQGSEYASAFEWAFVPFR